MTRSEIKRTIQHALEQNDLEEIASLAQRNRRVISTLIRMAYDKETLAGWRAIQAIGRVAKALVKTDEEFLRVTMRKLLWSLSDESGGIGWSAPEILGEIVSAAPEKFSDIIPLIAEVYEVEERVFRPGIVYALARIAEIAPERVAGYQKLIILSLTDKEPLVKVNALKLVERLWDVICKNNIWTLEYRDRVLKAISNLINDRGVAWIYLNDRFIDIEVGEKAKKLAKILEFMQ
jgi:hypothetical protein